MGHFLHLSTRLATHYRACTQRAGAEQMGITAKGDLSTQKTTPISFHFCKFRRRVVPASVRESGLHWKPPRVVFMAVLLTIASLLRAFAALKRFVPFFVEEKSFCNLDQPAYPPRIVKNLEQKNRGEIRRNEMEYKSNTNHRKRRKNYDK